MSQRQGKAPQGLAAAWERHSLSKGRREACPTKLTGSKLTGSNEKAAALAGGALGQHVLQLARGEALQLDLAGRGRADDADLGGGQGVDGGNLHVSADAMELEDDFAGLWHGSSIAHYGKQTLNRRSAEHTSDTQSLMRISYA